MELPLLALFDQSPEDPAARADGLFEMGYDTVVIPMDRDLARVSKSAGLNVWICTATFLVPPGAGDVLARDVYGVPRMWFRSGSPGLRSLRDNHLETVRTALRGPRSTASISTGSASPPRLPASKLFLPVSATRRGKKPGN